MKYILFLSTILVISCEYQPQKEYYVDLDTGTFGKIAINLLDQPDTFNLIEETDFTYALSVEEGQVVRSTEIVVDDVLIHSVGGENGSFDLIPGDYETGIHHMRFNVRTTTGTGSMGDVTGAESLTYTREWIFYTDHTPPQSLEITSISEFNGKIRIEWAKNEHLNFQRYIVRRTLYDPIDHSPQERGLAAIFDCDTNWFVDDSYIGGEVTYSIENLAMNTSAPGIPKSFTGSYPKIRSIKHDGDKLTFTWNPAQFTGNFSHYEITSSLGDYYQSILFTSDNVNDTVFSYTLPFGDSIDIWLNTVPVKVDYWYPETTKDQVYAYAGEKIPRLYSGLVHSNDPDMVYLVDFYYIRRYNLKTGVTERTLETDYNDWERPHVFVSPDGKYLVRATGNTAELLDPVTLARINTVDLSRFFSGSDELRFTAITNNGWLSVSMDVWPYVAGMVDMNTSDTVFTRTAYNWTTIDPSPGNKYMVIYTGMTRSLYRYEDGLVKLQDLNQEDQFKFNSLNEEELYAFSNNSHSITILNCSDLQIVRSIPVTFGLSSLKIDPVSGLLMEHSQVKAFLFDLDQQKIVLERDLKYTSYDYQMYSFFNNTLFSGFGYKLPLNQ